MLVNSSELNICTCLQMHKIAQASGAAFQLANSEVGSGHTAALIIFGKTLRPFHHPAVISTIPKAIS